MSWEPGRRGCAFSCGRKAVKLVQLQLKKLGKATLCQHEVCDSSSCMKRALESLETIIVTVST